MENHQFLCEYLWNEKKFQDDDVKRMQLNMTFLGFTLDQFMKVSNVPVGTPQKTLTDIKIVLKDDFRNLKY